METTQRKWRAYLACFAFLCWGKASLSPCPGRGTPGDETPPLCTLGDRNSTPHMLELAHGTGDGWRKQLKLKILTMKWQHKLLHTSCLNLTATGGGLMSTFCCLWEIKEKMGKSTQCRLKEEKEDERSTQYCLKMSVGPTKKLLGWSLSPVPIPLQPHTQPDASFTKSQWTSTSNVQPLFSSGVFLAWTGRFLK